MKNLIFSVLVFLGHLCFAQTERPITQKILSAQNQNETFATYAIFSWDQVSPHQQEVRNFAQDATLMQIDDNELLRLYNERPKHLKITFPFNGTSLTVLLERTQILTDTFHIETSSGTAIDYQPGAYYQGIVEGDLGSVVAFSFFENNVIGVASQPNVDNIVVGKLKGSNEYLSYAEGSLTTANPFQCETDELMKMQKEQVSFDMSQLNKKTLTENCVRIYYEIANTPYVNNSSDAVQTTNWITAIHNNIQTLYTNDNIKVALNAIFIWTTADPYTGTYSQNLNNFRINRPTFDGDLAHLVNHPATTSVAYLNSLCSQRRYAYSGISMTYGNVPTYSWTIQAMTHEMGHSLGSPHTHACAWNGNDTAIDGCGPSAGYDEGCTAPLPTNGGSIMSYCHLVGGVGINFSNGFGAQPAALIRNTVDSKACLGTNCLAPCSTTMTNLNLSNITTNSANASFNDSSSNSWKYRVRTVDNVTVTSGTTPTTQFSVSGLQPNTYYWVDAGDSCSGSQAFQLSKMMLTDDNWCEGKTFVDIGGAVGNYENNTTFVKTFYPSMTGDKIKMDFSLIDLELNYDYLYIYDGPSTSSPVFANGNAINGSVGPLSFTATNSSGAITVKFISDSYVTKQGWVASVSCLSALATDEFSAQNLFQLYPNPADDVLTITGAQKINSYKIVDASGRLIQQKGSINAKDVKVDVRNFLKGVYVISIVTEEGTYNEKFVKK